MAPEGLRRSSRIPREIAIRPVGSDMEGKVFSELTKTVLLSRHGAGIVSAYKLSAEQELILRSLETNQEAEVRVVGQLGSHGETYTYGVAFLDQHIDFWGVEFSPVSPSEKEANRVVLQCGSCKAHEVVQQSDLESDVYLVNEGIVRFCKSCGSSTLWKRPAAAVEPERNLPEPQPTEAEPPEAEQPPEPILASPPESIAASTPPPPESDPAPQPEARQENRRKHIRTRVSFKACVRSFAFGDDIVTCEDISRGGLRFKSRKPYTAKAEIEVAAPYSPGSQNIFVHAHIVYVLELTQEKLFRCGVAYAKS